MWSHYGDYHRGVCLEVELDDDQVEQCIYESSSKQSLVHKTKEWEYEEEWRVVKENKYHLASAFGLFAKSISKDLNYSQEVYDSFKEKYFSLKEEVVRHWFKDFKITSIIAGVHFINRLHLGYTQTSYDPPKDSYIQSFIKLNERPKCHVVSDKDMYYPELYIFKLSKEYFLNINNFYRMIYSNNKKLKRVPFFNKKFSIDKFRSSFPDNVILGNIDIHQLL
ncbi:DUF2971 domain-containing protein [Francisella tularensis subsp. novicida]|uniref:DUF2971 domain-containing protein n=2 Tax=Francisella tularensis TaxID=263 RepID=A0A6I4RUL0_FRATU|nr:DUF2971 domain-containing protein [Francisella tularensis]ABK89125.1 hypothetical protein FTN_0215 [Francisella tularensis subsp. novicida U112]AJI61568.1 hypothetical protein AW25_1830 [Francisella tularensis subsp. novicida U112]EDX18863.1 hypothetical protein FTE_0080 [Francisella tularensis subsp. novicida FTE]MBK2035376.1 DUF2971 domain-containing protein [Francisella tularensis subsp. novicida]MBK2115473.1 DUF2971 domain-containing protein [Francisella tularensis subsp. novicida]